MHNMWWLQSKGAKRNLLIMSRLILFGKRRMHRFAFYWRVCSEHNQKHFICWSCNCAHFLNELSLNYGQILFDRLGTPKYQIHRLYHFEFILSLAHKFYEKLKIYRHRWLVLLECSKFHFKCIHGLIWIWGEHSYVLYFLTSHRIYTCYLYCFPHCSSDSILIILLVLDIFNLKWIKAKLYLN